MSYRIEIQPDSWVLPNRVRFPEWVLGTFGYDDKKLDKNNFQLFNHQRFIKDYIQFDSPFRGVLLYHGLGVGKTCASVVAAEILMRHMDVLVFLPASLKQNYKNEIKKCGSHIYMQNQNWEFIVDSEKHAVVEEFRKKYRINRSIVKKHNGVWIAHGQDSDTGTPFHSLNDDMKTQLSKYIDDLIEDKYRFVHYNGLTRNILQSLNSDSLNNKTIIIDEVHNFISTAQRPKTLSALLYKKILEAKNSKIICLSGTPVINNPIELAYLINMLKGDMTVYTIKLNRSAHDNRAAIEYTLNKHPSIDGLDIDFDKLVLSFTLLPEGFKYVGDKSLNRIARSKDFVRNNVLVANILQELQRNGIEVVEYYGKMVDSRTTQCLPTDQDEFKNYFIDTEQLSMKNPTLFMRRTLGAVSSYEKYDPSLYPTKSDINIVKLKMSNEQFDSYWTARKTEIEKEARSKTMSRMKTSSDDIFTMGNIFKTFSRAACDFVFPRGMERPYPSTMNAYEKVVNKELDNIDVLEVDASKEDDDKEDKEIKRHEHLSYQQQLDKLMSDISKKQSKYLSGENLKKCSPKYHNIIQKINESPGSVLVYSQFRAVEGLGVFALSLQANGFCELKIKKIDGEWRLNVTEDDLYKQKYITFSSNDDEMSHLLNIFNSDFQKLPKSLYDDIIALRPKNHNKNLFGDVCKVLMITQSGAEGISLKNVRQVHIMEPYWNMIRIKQVIGRAIRANSHIDLKPEERHVDIFLYVMTLRKEHKTKFILKTKDDGLTTDQIILNIALRKQKIIDQFLDALKKASIDCVLNTDQPKTCFSYPSSMPPAQLSYTPAISKDLTDARYLHNHSRALQTKLAYSRIIVIKNNDGTKKKYGVLDTNDNDFSQGTQDDATNLIDLEAFEKLGRIKVVGYMKENKLYLFV